jgi:hypothetical protein
MATPPRMNRYPTSFGGRLGKKGCNHSTSSAAYPTAQVTMKAEANDSAARRAQDEQRLPLVTRNSDRGDSCGCSHQEYLPIRAVSSDRNFLTIESLRSCGVVRLQHMTFRHIASRRGAMIAVRHSILVIIYPMLCEHVSYTELGGNYFDEHDRQATEKRLVRRL